MVIMIRKSLKFIVQWWQSSYTLKGLGVKSLLRTYHTPNAIIKIGDEGEQDTVPAPQTPSHPASGLSLGKTRGINTMLSNICSEREYKIRTRRRSGGSLG